MKICSTYWKLKKCEGETNDHTLCYELVFRNVFERSAVLMKYRCKVITFQMAQQLKTKTINIVPGQLSCRQCKAIFC